MYRRVYDRFRRQLHLYRETREENHQTPAIDPVTRALSRRETNRVSVKGQASALGCAAAALQYYSAHGDTWLGTVRNLRYGLKYYFVVKVHEQVIAERSFFIPCPQYACCGTDDDDAKKCVDSIPKGVLLTELVSQKGAYQVNGAHFEQCLNLQACHGGASSQCADGYEGMLCDSCQTGFARRGEHQCGPCDGWSTVYTVIALVAFAGISVYFIYSTLSSGEKTLEIEMAKIALSGSQALTVLGRYPLRWPRQ